MNTTSPSISKAIKLAVENANLLLQADTSIVFPNGLAKQIYFMQGNGVEITKKLQQLTQGVTTKTKKYPLVWLYRDLKEDLIYNENGFASKCRPKIIILSLTDINYESDKRETENFEKVLRPVFEKFIQSILGLQNFCRPTMQELNITKFERFYWGSSQVEQKTNDPVDAIELDLDLTIKNIKQNC